MLVGLGAIAVAIALWGVLHLVIRMIDPPPDEFDEIISNQGSWDVPRTREETLRNWLTVAIVVLVLLTPLLVAAIG